LKSRGFKPRSDCRKIITPPVLVNRVSALAAWCVLYGNGTINQWMGRQIKKNTKN